MDLPTRTLAAGLAEDSAGATLGDRSPQGAAGASLLLGATQDRSTDAIGLGLLAVVAAQNGVVLPASLQEQVGAAWKTLEGTPAPLAQALLMLGDRLPPGRADTVLSAVRAEMPTIDRALALVWVQKKLGGPPPPKVPDLTLDGAWRKADSRFGIAAWHWSDAKGLPDRLHLAQAAAAGTVAVVQYETRAPDAHALPVLIVRRILRLKQDKEGYRAEPLKPDEALHTDELYMDEITLKSAADSHHRFGLLEVALPPGASVEASTWGIRLLGGPEPVALERARHVERRDGYAVPIDVLAGELTVRHLLRFAQKGRYVLPPTRFHRMYQPDQKAFEGAGKAAARTVQVE
jgi:uncharacterized protein YfaS (alpha-2-macroglobulin family)